MGRSLGRSVDPLPAVGAAAQIPGPERGQPPPAGGTTPEDEGKNKGCDYENQTDDSDKNPLDNLAQQTQKDTDGTARPVERKTLPGRNGTPLHTIHAPSMMKCSHSIYKYIIIFPPVNTS